MHYVWDVLSKLFSKQNLSELSLLVCQHEKFSSQLQLNQKKPPEGDSSKSEVKPSVAAAAAAVCEGAATKPSEAFRAEDKTSGEVYNTTWLRSQSSDDALMTSHVQKYNAANVSRSIYCELFSHLSIGNDKLSCFPFWGFGSLLYFGLLIKLASLNCILISISIFFTIFWHFIELRIACWQQNIKLATDWKCIMNPKLSLHSAFISNIKTCNKCFLLA